MERASAVGLQHVGYAAAFDVADPSGIELVDFLLGHLAVESPCPRRASRRVTSTPPG